MHTLELTCGEQRILLPRLALGTGSFGKTVSPAQAFALLDRYRGAAGTCIDTARMYADGASEEIIGEYLTPVSYTHLDVYKRQPTARADGRKTY